MADSLQRLAVAYLNLDVSANGRSFHAGGTATLWDFITDLAVAANQPGESLSVYQAWRRDAHLADSAAVPIGDLGGGSDFAGFYNVLGIPSFEIGFGGRYGVYHSAYDTFNWMDRFGDPGYLSHAEAARLTATALTRLANTDVLPFDYAGFGRALGAVIAQRQAQARAASMPAAAWGDLDSAVTRLIQSGARLDSLRLVLERAMPRTVPTPASLEAANDSLRLAAQAFVRPDGIPGRPFYRNVLFAPGRNDGYGAVGLPAISEAIEDGKGGAMMAEVADLTARVARAAALVDGASARLVTPAR
jgi:N-acetylated-alpha-linked acidic dipeptidase